MAEYIERDKLGIGRCNPEVFEDKGYAKGWNAAIDIIQSAPAADVRPVVLCRDCKYSYDSVGGWCCSHGICVDCIVREDFFCADGAKREES